MDLTKQGRRTIVMCVALSAVTLAAYWPVTGAGFINFDDQDYVVNNPHVTGGLRWSNVAWAFETGHVANWHPLTWLSHIVDCQLYGLRARGHHVTSLVLHVVNTLLLFGLLRGMWKSRVPGLESKVSAQVTWRCFFVAALFAVHPLHVESVAWVAERKDVLSGMFFLLTLWAYCRHVEIRRPKSEGRKGKAQGGGGEYPTEERGEHPTSNIQHPTSNEEPRAPRTTSYLLSLLFFALGLMSKPMLVTVPFILLLLDYWPLARLRWHSLESKVSSPESTEAATRTTHHAPRTTGDARKSQIVDRILEKLPFFALSAASCLVTFLVQRGAGAVVNIGDWPFDYRICNALVSYVRYLSRTAWPAGLAVFYPPPVEWPLEWVVGSGAALAVGSALAVWLARRAPWFTVGWFWYLGMLVPVIGLVQVGSQSMADRYTYLPLIGIFIIVVWGAGSLGSRVLGLESQVSSLKSRVSRVESQGFRLKTLDFGLKTVLASAAVLACGWLTHRQAEFWTSSQRLFEHALAVTSDNFVAHDALGAVFMTRGDAATAEPHFAEAVRLRPYDAEARASLAAALTALHRAPEAVEQYEEALKLRADMADALNNLAWILAANPDPGVRNGPKAVELAERACKLTDYKRPMLVGTLAAAYAEAGRFNEAVRMAQRAEKLAEQDRQPEIAARNRELLELYRAGKAYREER